MKWVAFMSRTGSELAALIQLGYIPDTIVMNKSGLETVCVELKKQITNHNIQIIFTRSTPTADDYKTILGKIKPDLITLHGWLRIIPADVCAMYPARFYNLHPGLITEYPELKGKDPQERIAGKGYEKIGVVIHEVVAGVDEGKVIIEMQHYTHPATDYTTDEVYNMCAKMGVRAWQKLFHMLNFSSK